MIDFDDLTWTCNVCGKERPDYKISVHRRQGILLRDSLYEEMGFNARYCNDDPVCIGVACATGPWEMKTRST